MEAHAPFESGEETDIASNGNAARIEWKSAESFKDFDNSDSDPKHLNFEVRNFSFPFKENNS